ncbi:Zinc finger C6HC-type [Colletotrichum asianum]
MVHMHDNPRGGNTLSPNESSLENGQLCRDYRRGRCAKDDDCEFSHDNSLFKKTALNFRTFFSTGLCHFGEECSFSHVNVPLDQFARVRPTKARCRRGSECRLPHGDPEEDTLSTETDSRTQQLLGATFTFGPGASVCDVTLPDNSTAVILNIVGPCSTTAVQLLLEQRGFHVPLTSIKLRSQDSGLKYAVVNGRVPGFAELLRANFEKKKAHGKFSGIKVVTEEINPISEKEDFHVVTSRKIECSWPKDRDGSDFAFEKNELAMVEAMLAAVGEMETRPFLGPDDEDRMLESVAWFKRAEDAKRAAQTFDGTPLAFNSCGLLSVKQIHSTSYKLSTRVFQSLIDEVKELHGHRDALVKVKTSCNTEEHTILSLESDNLDALETKRQALDDLFAGKVISYSADTDSPVWSPYFDDKAFRNRILDQIAKDCGVAFHCLPVSKEIKLYGPPENIEKANEALFLSFENNFTTVHPIDLNENAFNWAIRGGFKALCEALGQDAVRYKSVWPPSQINIAGSVSSYELALDIISQRSTFRDAVERLCSVCWTEPDQFLTTTCGHVYCLDCFQNFCRAGDTNSGGFKVACIGNNGLCRSVIGLDELAQHLSPVAFEQLLASSAESYVNKRPEELRYCPTADCGYIYRVSSTENSRYFECPSCGKATCPSCHNSHPAISCAERRDKIARGDEKKLRKCKRKLGVKDCPKCHAPIEKWSGCNHMSCRCGAHICWVCLANFETGDECTLHLRQKHETF